VEKYNHLTIRFLHEPGYIFNIPYNNGAQRLLNIVSREEKVSFVITAFTTMGLILRDCSILSDTCSRASEQLIMQVDRHNTMNRGASYLAVCLRNNH
jgi:hypothetical protein